MNLILFDLDGTLLATDGLGRQSSRKALEEIFGTSGDLDHFYPGGRTQEAIFLDTLTDAGISETEYHLKRQDLYSCFLNHFKQGLNSGKFQVRALPGAREMLAAALIRSDLLLGIVTGNQTEIASLKLTSAGLDPSWFQVGSYGQESANRPDLVPIAQKRAKNNSGIDFSGNRTVVVGDTTRDVISAKESGAVSIGITTGTDTREMLQEMDPDYLIDSLVELSGLLEQGFD